MGNGIVVEDKCVCFNGYTYIDCSRKACPRSVNPSKPSDGEVECAGHGLCKDGACMCEVNFHVEPSTGTCVASVAGQAAICGKSCTKQCLQQCPQDQEITVYNACITSCQRTCKNDCMASQTANASNSAISLTPLN